MRPRVLIIILCVSLALNVFLVGAVAGGWATRQHGAEAPAAQRGSLLRRPAERCRRRAVRSSARP